MTDDQLAHAARITDTGLKNAWGMSYPPTAPFWVSSTDGGRVRLYSVNPATQAADRPLTVSVSGGSVTGRYSTAHPHLGIRLAPLDEVYERRNHCTSI
ncbi:MAG TPA: hypothetical protein VJM47_05675 [Nitrosospira sp.]|nr:hypothetical protein [Nitrosospira sp.]